MKIARNFSLIFAILLFLPVGCLTEDEDPIDYSYQELRDYVISNELDFSDMLDNWVVAPPSSIQDAGSFIGSHSIFDLRSPAEFTSGRIEGSINVTMGSLTDLAASSDKPILLVSATGQKAAYAYVALRLSGFENVKVLKHGISSWNSDFSGEFVDGLTNLALGSVYWNQNPDQGIRIQYEAPRWKAQSRNGEQIFQERLDYLWSTELPESDIAEVLDNPDKFFINTVVTQHFIDTYGTLENAVNYRNLSLANADFRRLDSDKKILTYCLDGCSSAALTAYLQFLGFDATSLSFGMNGMIYSGMDDSERYSIPSVDLPVVSN